MKRPLAIAIVSGCAGVLLVSACARPGPVERTREGGVEVVINHIEPYRLKGRPSTFSLEKVLTIDTERDDLAEAGLGSAGEWDADGEGNIYIVGFKNPEKFIFRFDRSGDLLGSFGRRGQGPGELQWPFLSGVSADGVVSLSDYGQKCIDYTRDGQVLRETTLKGRAFRVDPLENGKFLVFGPLRPDPQKPDVFIQVLTLRDADFEEIKVLDRYESTMGSNRQVPFFMWRVSAGRIFIANQARGYEIWVYDLEGNLMRKIRKEYRTVKVTENIKEAILGPDYRKSGLPQDRYFPDPLPPLNQFFADDEGRIFVMTYEPGPNAEEYIWDIFDPDGVCVNRKALDIMWTGLYLGPRYTFAKEGLLYCHHEKESGFHELAVYRMVWQ